ncbi:MAG: hypothetical protein NC340_02755 [Ruminococcus flavefaciens]|nr:hypothetical protein [Ruminococcus flavefaciens]MCM1229421.1 hypothetical protein [Ruminococcus flavefaciens]
MINGQGTGETAKLRYGLFPASLNGCEAIAVCNALEYLGIPQDICAVLKFMERYAVFFGLFGCNIYCLGRALKHFGAESEKVKTADNAEAFIISSWTGKPFLSSIHTVFCIRRADKVRVYNRYNNFPSEKIYNSSDDIFGGRKPLVIYKIREK